MSTSTEQHPASTAPRDPTAAIAQKISSLSITDNPSLPSTVTGAPTTDSETQTPPTPPSTTKPKPDGLKRSDPFQFGSRYLDPEDDPFSFNAWDHVETDAEYNEYAEQQYAFHRSNPVTDFDKKRFNDNPEKWWDLFYKNNKENFFKDRKWLQQEFPILSTAINPTSPPTRILEVGCGAGNTLFPILSANQNPNLHIHGSDFSSVSVSLIKSNPLYTTHHPQNISASVWDLGNAAHTLPEGVEPYSIDIIILIFVFSALHPDQWTHAIKNIKSILKPGGRVLFRDYGRGDLAQVRFKKGRYLEDNFYVRGDGTRVYFFEKEEIEGLFTGEVGKMRCEKLEMDRRMLVNRARKLKMYRCWLQGLFVLAEEGVKSAKDKNEKTSTDSKLEENV